MNVDILMIVVFQYQSFDHSMVHFVGLNLCWPAEVLYVACSSHSFQTCSDISYSHPRGLSFCVYVFIQGRS